MMKINLKIFQINRELYLPTTPKNQPLPKKKKKKKNIMVIESLKKNLTMVLLVLI